MKDLYSFLMVDNLKHADLTGPIIGAAMKVHSNSGGGNFTENIFHRALLFELAEAGIFCESEKDLPVYYKGKLIGRKRVDILVEGKILLELTAISQMENIHFNQVINYLKVFNWKWHY